MTTIIPIGSMQEVHTHSPMYSMKVVHVPAIIIMYVARMQ